MELFSEIYGCYYNVVYKVLKAAHEQGVSTADINKIVEEEAFAESSLHLIPKLIGGDWSLLKEDKSSRLWKSKLTQDVTKKPLSELQKSWLKAIMQDVRIKLFLEDSMIIQYEEWLKDSEPLFALSDFHIFDVALDGDDYNDEMYISRFRIILSAIKAHKSLIVEYKNAKGTESRINIIPVNMQYSEKDDKFRVLAWKNQGRNDLNHITLNVGRITDVKISNHEVPTWINTNSLSHKEKRTSEVVLHISQERNALERCMMQFAFYEKETKSEDNGKGYRCHIKYALEEESELLIRILSFGPVVKVLEPERVVKQIRERVKNQFSCLVKL